MRPIQKPPWLIYAAEVREHLDNMPLRKSEKPFERAILEGWKTAWREKGYEGSLADWQILLHRLGSAKRRAS